MKKNKATVADKQYIQANKTLDVQQLSKDTELTVSAVRKVLEDLPQDKPGHIAPSKKEPTQFSKMLGRSKLSDGRPGGAVIMTPGASELADEQRKPGKMTNLSHIHKPLG